MNNRTLADRLVPWIAYPLVMLTGLAVHGYAQQAGIALSISANAAVLLGALLVTLLEMRFPHSQAWRPHREDIQQDLLYMVLVQMVLPKVLVFLCVLALVEPMQALQLPVQQWWPHELPIAVQAVLMVLLADFLRYWLHRAAHHYQPLWRLHAVHHSPSRLYWLNVARFHPLEKALQFVFDALPFLLLGVDAQVIAWYFVFYAINGFFQHSNIELRYGPLNYLISSAELHRWHHSRIPQESNTNFGNNVIIWDLLFGTRFLPRDRRIDDLGLKNRRYPLRFVEQLATPFTPRITDEDVPLQSLGRLLRRLRLWRRP
jgi:sterol desaturase/sphingolipid hydroxylase (fatty acid hydroxylase superfamily)